MRCVWPIMYQYMIVAVVLVAALHTKTCYAIPTGSSRLNASVEGSVLTWWLRWDDSSNEPIVYSVAVYTSLDSMISSTSQKTTATTFDLDTLSLKDGTYYLQVQAFIDSDTIIYGKIIVYNVTTHGKSSQSQSIAVLLGVTLSVLSTAIAAGSCLFAFTMWRIRRRGRLCSREQNATSTRSGCMCLCRSPARHSTTHSGRAGLHLCTIEARDKNKQLLPLHLAKQDLIARRLDKISNHSSAIQQSMDKDDLPYGYVSPADINIPQFRGETRLTTSEGGLRHPKPTNECMYTASEGGARQAVSEKTTASWSESIYSIPCSPSPILEKNEEKYLTILPR